MVLEHHILHRDISLGNLMFDRHGSKGNVGRLIDFDLAKCILPPGFEKPTPGDFRMVHSISSRPTVHDSLIQLL